MESMSETVSTKISPERWLDEHGDHLYRYALLQLGNSALAEDMVQDTLVAGLEGLERFQGRASEKTWLTGILRHKILDYFRRARRESVAEDIETLADSAAQEVGALFDVAGHWISPPQDWGQPEKRETDQQFLKVLAGCMQRLKPAMATAFVLKEIDGHSNQEISKELGVSDTNCGVLLYRARMSLRRCLDVRWADGDQQD
jgi:RNA polymerase sigma-70 factor (ECF subfamily)